MRVCALLSVVGAVCGLLVTPGSSEACGRRRVCYTSPVCYPPPACCPPCHRCCPPDESPLHPLPAHPVPHTTLPHTLTLKNDTDCHSFVTVYIRHPDCVYRVYDKKAVPPRSAVALDPARYFAGDHLLVETWTRTAPTAPWHCRCGHLITLAGGSGTFAVVGCGYTHH